jgi:hypothetical protein
MDQKDKYSINLNAAYGPLQRIDVNAMAQSVNAPGSTKRSAGSTIA